MKFDIEKFKTEKIAVNCRTEKELYLLIKYLQSNEPLFDNLQTINYFKYNQETCIYYSITKQSVIYDDTLSMLHHDYKVFQFSDLELSKVVDNSDKKDLLTIEKIDILFDSFKEFLKEKNKRYGDSALKPAKIFTKQNAGSQICNRLDDKISRIQNSNELKKNDVSDLFGYTALLMIENGWLDFSELLD
jgi:hypothetical protein